ncbi:MAG: MqnA/MqnD/SBP family protein, partial [bacterium]
GQYLCFFDEVGLLVLDWDVATSTAVVKKSPTIPETMTDNSWDPQWQNVTFSDLIAQYMVDHPGVTFAVASAAVLAAQAAPSFPIGTIALFVHGRIHLVAATGALNRRYFLSSDILLPADPSSVLRWWENQYLNSGAALGFGCGPLVVVRRSFSRGDLAQARVAIPGEWTTAHLLFQLWAPPGARKLFVPYDRIIETVLRGEADAGILIHESRFVFAKAGLVRLADLGEWWEAETGLPLPLGCVMARKALGLTAITELDRLLKRCVEHSRSAPGETAGYVRRHAVEMDDEAIRQHIALYVTDYSADLGGTGREAMAVLERKAREAGVLK